MTPHPDDQSTRLALARMAGARARVCTRPRFVAACLATAAVAAGVNLAGGVLDLVTGALTGVVTAGQSPPTRTTAETRLGQVARPVGSLMTTQTGHRHRHLKNKDHLYAVSKITSRFVFFLSLITFLINSSNSCQWMNIYRFHTVHRTRNLW